MTLIKNKSHIFDNNKLFYYCIILSILVHLSFLYYNFPNIGSTSLLKRNKTSRIINIKLKEKLKQKTFKKKYKIVGKKDSHSKNSFQLKNLQQKFLSFFKNQNKILTKTQSRKNKSTQSTNNKHQIIEYRQSVNSLDLPTTKQVIAQKLNSFGIMLEAPKGTDFDSLNAVEKVAHIFYKRVFKQFVNSFLQSMNNIKQSYPMIENDLYKEVIDSLQGKVTFDTLGNIKTIKIIKSSDNKNIYTLFENTLTGILKIQNPPKVLIKNNHDFSIYFTINLN